MEQTTRLCVRFLGSPDVSLGASIRFSYAKVLALLAFLVCEEGRQRRERLTYLLWPNHAEDTARANLRNALHALKKILGAHRVCGDRQYVWLSPDEGDYIDIALLRQAVTHSSLAATHQAAAMDLMLGYSGEFMANFTLPDAPDYMQWQDTQRLISHKHLLSLSEHLLCLPAVVSNKAQQIALMQKQTLIDPWNELFHLRLMQLLVDDGRTATALAHFDYVHGLFQRELDTQPSPEVQALVGRLRASTDLPSTAAPKGSPTQHEANPKTRLVTLLYVEIRCLAGDDAQKFQFLQQAREFVACETRRQGAHTCVTPDGSLMAYFGYPEYIPDAIQRAMRSADSIRKQAQALNVLLRLSLNHGPMMFSRNPHSPDALGLISNTTLRLVTCGRSGDILATASFVKKAPTLPELIPLQLPAEVSLDEQMQAYRLASMPKLTQRAASILIGRQQERARLKRLASRTQPSGLGAALLIGDAGCGKTRLVQWLMQSRDHSVPTLVFQCRQTCSETPYAPISAFIKEQCGIGTDDDLNTRTQKLSNWVGTAQLVLALPHRLMLGWLAGVPLPYESSLASPGARRNGLHDALHTMLGQLTQSQAVLVVVEDIHWADSSTTKVLEELVDSRQDGFLLLTARNPLDPNWLPQVPRIELGPLPPEQSRALIEALCCQTLGENEISKIIDSAQGNPLHIESFTLAQSAATANDTSLPSMEDYALRPVAQDGLLRSIALTASALGDEFSAVTLRSLFAGESDDRFYLALRALQQHGLIRPGLGNQYCFHHTVVRDILYANASRSELRHIHSAIQKNAQASALSMAHPPHWLARHASLAGDLPAAIGLLEEAAKLDLDLAAYAEAISHLQDACKLLERLPASTANDTRMLRLLLTEGNATVAIKGYGAAETRSVFGQVLARSKPQENAQEVFLALYGLWLGASSNGGYRHALRYVDKLQQHAHSAAPLYRLQTAYAYGNTHLWLGELTTARRYLEDAVTLYDTHLPAEMLQLFHEDTGVTSLALLAWVAWLQGDMSAAEQAQARALALARQLSHPYTLCFALACWLRLAVMKGEAELVHLHIGELLALAEKHAFTLWQAIAQVMQGWAICARPAQEAQVQGAIETMQRGLATTCAALPALEVTPLSIYADALFRLGRNQDCADLLDCALQRCLHWDDHYMEPELLRLRSRCESPV